MWALMTRSTASFKPATILAMSEPASPPSQPLTSCTEPVCNDGLNVVCPNFRDQRVDGLRLVAELEARGARGRHDGRRLLERHPDEGDRDVVEALDAVRGKQRLRQVSNSFARLSSASHPSTGRARYGKSHLFCVPSGISSVAFTA